MTPEDFSNRPVAFTEFVAEILLNKGCSLDFGVAKGLDFLSATSKDPPLEKQYVVALRDEEVRGSLLSVLKFTKENPEKKIFICVLNLGDKQFLERVLLPRTQNVEICLLPLLERYSFYKKDFESRKSKI
ncbi:hypothetical protein RM549_03140 [Salegentibacter sp. F188]|uniref:Uncharacterized protein n=1 Tax=Autumnicola patrickiae TaxID=3075591 RepID=A0ABU3DYH3_9FLAO|nr:hypothetical protein [Salegentibacter sp. F188]MDT0688761.1 hypothetical protein [Salegentibacter sp. F188]